MNRPLLVAVLVQVLLVSCGPVRTETSTPVPPTALPNTLYVDPGRDLGPISPYVYGSNFGPWTAVPVGKMEAALNSHVTALRFPGGNWGDSNDIQTYQLDSFMNLCKQMGAIPTISVRLLDGTPEAATQLLRYANIEKDYQIRYWSPPMPLAIRSVIGASGTSRIFMKTGQMLIMTPCALTGSGGRSPWR